MKPMFNSPGTKRLKRSCDILLSTSACKLNLRRCIQAEFAGNAVDYLHRIGRTARAHTRPLFSSTSAVSDTKCTLT